MNTIAWDLNKAAAANSKDDIEALLRKGADINELDGHGRKRSVLAEAAANGYLDLAAYAIKKGANVNLQDCDGRTALLAATIQDNLKMVIYLVEQGADVNLSYLSTDDEGNEVSSTPLDTALMSLEVQSKMGACHESTKKIIEFLCKAGGVSLCSHNNSLIQYEMGAKRTEQVAQGTKIFISYFARESQAVFAQMTTVLTALGYDVFEPASVGGLQNPSEIEMRANVANSSLLLAIMSPGYFDSKWCMAEADEAMKRKIVSLPVVNGDDYTINNVMGFLTKSGTPQAKYIFSKNVIKVIDRFDQKTTTKNFVQAVKNYLG